MTCGSPQTADRDRRPIVGRRPIPAKPGGKENQQAGKGEQGNGNGTHGRAYWPLGDVGQDRAAAARNCFPIWICRAWLGRMEQSALPDLRYVKVDEVEEVEGAP